MSKHFACQFTKQAHLCWLIQFLIDRVDALASVVSDSTKSVSGHGARNGTWCVGHDEAHGAPADGTDHGPESAGWGIVLALGHTLLSDV
jgi:hypothetical protein